MKKIILVFPFLICLFLTSFYRYTFIQQENDFINYQKQVLEEKVNMITKSVEDMLVRENDWKKEANFYKHYLIDSIEVLDKEPTQHVILLDEKYNILTNRFSPEAEWKYEPFNFKEVFDEIKLNNNGCNLVCINENKIINKKVRLHNVIIYCYAWTPSIKDQPRYLVFAVLTPSKLSYTNKIFTYGAIINILFTLILSLYFIHIFKKINYKKINYKKIKKSKTKVIK